MFDGILIIDKPEGITSHDVVARCRRILRTKRVGHTGTLDPFATGVVVVLVGRATRLAQFLDKDAKEYEAVARFGFETDTGDLTGKMRNEGKRMNEAEIAEILKQIGWDEVLGNFRGKIEQTPPMYSAKKIEGKKLYELARKGVEIERKPVSLTIYELEIAENQKPKTEDRIAFRVLCSAGTYIRTLAEDIGRKIGVGAHLTELRRTRAGKFSIEQAVTLEKLEEIAKENRLDEILVSMNEAVSHLSEVALSAEEISKIKNGIRLKKDLKDSESGDFLRLTTDESLLAIGIYDDVEKNVQPKMVLV